MARAGAPDSGCVIAGGRTIDTPAVNKIVILEPKIVILGPKVVILGLGPSIRVGNSFEWLPSVTNTCAAWDPRVTHEDDDGGAL